MEPIFEAVLNGHNQLVRLLKASPESANLRMVEDYLVETIPHWLYVGDTPLHLGAAALQFKAAEVLLDCGADVNAENRRGATPLHYACDPRPMSGGTWQPQTQADLIKLFIQRGAKLEHVDRGGASALHRAVRSRSPAAVRQLLAAGACVGVRLKKMGSTPLHLAVQSTGAGGTAGAIREQLETIELLFQHGADPNDRDNRGRTAIDWATNETLRSVLRAPR